jgi:hypothetical protein
MVQYEYEVKITGLNGVPLRTTIKGAKLLIQAFHNEPKMAKLLLEAVDSGTAFKSNSICISRIPTKKLKKVSNG